MVDGKPLFVLLALLLVTPSVLGAPPEESFSTAVSLAGQDVSDLAVDGTGRFAVALPTYSSPKIPLAQAETKRDVYVCDFVGSGCRGYDHIGVTGNNGASQKGDAVSFVQPNGITARFAVGGPSDSVSLWSNLRSSPEWRSDLPGENGIVAVAVDPSTARWSQNTAFVAVAHTTGSLGTTGAVSVLFANNGTVKWSFPTTSATGATADVRPTSLAWSANGDVLVVGTTKGILFLKPQDSARPADYRATDAIDLGSVSEVLVSRDANAVLARTSDGIDYVPMANDRPKQCGNFACTAWTRPLSGTPSAIALSDDGRVFAAASGTQVHFFRHLNNSFIAEPIGRHDSGQSVADLDYDATGSLLVAAAGTRVLGFGPSQTTPIWTFDATFSVNGGLDGPLREVSVSGDASRIVVAGKTKIMPYATRVSATLEHVGATTRSVSPGSSATVAFDVTNDGSLPDNFTLVVTRPVGWTGVNPGTVSLNPDQTQRVNITVEAPPGERPGTEGVKVSVRSNRTGDFLRNDRNEVMVWAYNLTVPRAVALEVRPTVLQDVFQPGTQGSIEVIVRNVGNAAGLVNMTSQQSLTRGPSWQVRFEPEQLSIPARGEATTRLVVTPPSDATSGDRNNITVIAKEGSVTQASHYFNAYINPEFAVDVNTGAINLELYPGETRTFTVNVTNRGNTADRYNITANVTPLGQVNDWYVRVSQETLDIEQGRTRQVTITVKPNVAEPATGASLVIRATSLTATGNGAEDSVSVGLIPRTVDEEEDRGLPMPPVSLLLLGVGAAALARRTLQGARR